MPTFVAPVRRAPVVFPPSDRVRRTLVALRENPLDAPVEYTFRRADARGSAVLERGARVTVRSDERDLLQEIVLWFAEHGWWTRVGT